MKKQKRYLVLGNGWIGTHIAKYLGARTTTKRLQTGRDLPRSLWNNFEVMINAVAKTNIDWCEKNKRESLLTNTLIAKNLAEECAKRGKKYVFLSSACIFESKGRKDIKYENSEPNPKCFYSETKVIAEKLVTEANPKALLIRIRLPLSTVPHPRNTLTKMEGYKTLSTQQESVTVIEDMLPILKELIEKDAKGIYHLINKNTISPAEIGRAMNYSFKTISKESLDKKLAKEKRAKRVTVFAGSKKIPLLPDIRKKMPIIAKQYLANLNED